MTFRLALGVASALMMSAFTILANDDASECARLASYPDDPDRSAPGVATADLDFDAALAACSGAIKANPKDAQSRYQYGRLLFYSGDSASAMTQIKQAADDDYRQAQFVYGSLISNERPDAPRDICQTEKYWLKSARAGRQAARVGYVRHTLRGRFDQCESGAGPAELASLLNSASEEKVGYYERLLIADLRAELAAAHE